MGALGRAPERALPLRLPRPRLPLKSPPNSGEYGGQASTEDRPDNRRFAGCVAGRQGHVYVLEPPHCVG